MRRKSIQEQYFDVTEQSTLKVVTEYRQKYQALSEALDGNPDLLARAHRDWARLLSSSPEGRAGDTSEQLLRALLVMFLEGDSYRDVVIRIDTSEFLRHFVRLGFKATMDFTFLNRAFGVLSAETLVAMNQGVARSPQTDRGRIQACPRAGEGRPERGRTPIRAPEEPAVSLLYHALGRTRLGQCCKTPPSEAWAKGRLSIL